MAMLRHRAAQRATMPTRILYSTRTPDDTIYKDELEGLASQDQAVEVFFTFTRQTPAGWTGYQRRIDAAMLGEVIKPFGMAAHTYVCGPTVLVETVANVLLQMGLPAEQIRTERFGPTGP
jgi:ferredoxin-NADP reductase